jgi:hypothetical protein
MTVNAEKKSRAAVRHVQRAEVRALHSAASYAEALEMERM